MKMILYFFIQAVIGVSAGILIAGSFLAFLSMIGIVPRLAAVTKTMDRARSYEDMIIAGAVIGNLISLYQIQLPVYQAGLLIYGFFGGFFIGCLAAALSEVLKSVPIFSRRMHMRKGIPYVVYSLALGKISGSLIQFFLLS